MQNRDLNNLLNKYGIKPVKHLGQNFLLDEAVLEKIIAAADLSQNDIVLEIGPGLGILTFALAKKAKQVVAVEKDKKFARILNNELKIRNIKNVKIISADILKIRDFLFPIHDTYKIVANLPYYITSPAIRMFLETKKKPELLVFMIQKEVGQRICAKPPRMSLLSIMVQFYAEPEIVDYVGKKSFYPEPKVDSTIIKIIPKKNLPEINAEKFFQLVRAGFSAKRKFLINNLSKKLKTPNSKLKTIFEQIGIGQKLRAENLSVKNWIKLYENIENYLE